MPNMKKPTCQLHDSSAAQNILLDSFQRVSVKAPTTCCIADAIDTVFNGDKCLTYQYILFTALLAKSVDERIDMLSLQSDDRSEGAYAPRTLCKEVVYPFQRDMLEDVMNGANNDPLVNKPARFLRLTKSNQARGDGKRALLTLCEELPKVKSQGMAVECLDYLLSKLLDLATAHREEEKELNSCSLSCSTHRLREFFSKLLGQRFGGDALLLVASALYRIQFPTEAGFKVIPHPVNRPGTASSQFSDLDVTKDGKPYLGTELKDKLFSEQDVRRAADSLSKYGVTRLAFVSGRDGGLIEQNRQYFASVKDDYNKRGIFVGLSDIDSLMDFVLVSNSDIDVEKVLVSIYDQARHNGSTPETIRWLHKELITMGQAK